MSSTTELSLGGVKADDTQQSITRPISGIVEERISAYYYRISLLKMQVHSNMLAQSRNDTSCTSTANEDFSTYQQDLDTWLKDWKDVVNWIVQRDNAQTPQLLQVLEAWGSLNYHHTVILISSLPSTAADSPSPNWDDIVTTCGFLFKHQQSSLLLRQAATYAYLAPVYVSNWTTAHLIFNVGLKIFTGDSPGATVAPQRMGAARRCLRVMALLEGDPANLSSGFSEVLERLYSNDEHAR